MSKSFSGFMAIGWKFMKQIDGTQDWPIYTQKWIRLGKLCLLACLSLVNWKGGVYYRLRWTCFCTKTNSNFKLHLKFDFRHLCTKMTFITWSHPGHLSSGWLIVVWNTRSLMASQIGCIKVCDCHYHFFISQKDSWI